MLFPVGLPQVVHCAAAAQEQLAAVSAEAAEAAGTEDMTIVGLEHSPHDGTLFAVATPCSLSLWSSYPLALLATHRRGSDTYGAYTCLQWRRDGCGLAAVTSSGHVLFFTVQAKHGSHVFTLKFASQRQQPAFGVCRPINSKSWAPSVSVARASTAAMSHHITAIVDRRTEVLAATTAGVLERVSWDAPFFDATSAIVLSTIPFEGGQPGIRRGVYVVHMAYCKPMRLLALALSDGSAACVTAKSSNFTELTGQWISLSRAHNRGRSGPDFNAQPSATCVALNPRFRIVAVGCSNGDSHVFSVEESGAPTYSHSLYMPGTDIPGINNGPKCGAVRQLQWTRDGCALACAWQDGGVAVWSTYGALLKSPIENTGDVDVADPEMTKVSHVSWGPEGYQLFVAPDNDSGHVVLLQFVKSALATSPSLSNQSHVLLQGDDRILVNSEAEQAGVSQHVDKLCDVQWQAIQVPSVYLSSYWPIQNVVTDDTGKFIAVAGKAGLAHYSMVTRKWRLFGSQAQEQEFSVRGGMVWWRHYVVVGCENLRDHTDELRVYPRAANLDNRFLALQRRLTRPVFLLNIFGDYLLVYSASRRASIFKLSIDETGKSGSSGSLMGGGSGGGAGGGGSTYDPVNLNLVWEMELSDYIPHSSCLVSLALARVGTEYVDDTAPGIPHALIANVAGKLLMFSVDIQEAAPSFSAPVLLATGVESYWVPARATKTEQHLRDSLWINCGGAGMKVWLPLYKPRDAQAVAAAGSTAAQAVAAAQQAAQAAAAASGSNTSMTGGGASTSPGGSPHADPRVRANSAGTPPRQATASFLSKRVMLPFKLKLYPLTIFFEDAVILGATHNVSQVSIGSNKPPCPFYTVERKIQLYLHHIIRQLIRRSLEAHALEIAQACTSLPYFSHMLELLLHEVLEEEAYTEKAVVREGMILPRVNEFLSSFDEYMEVVVHCARKTEVARWPYLFAQVGTPSELFERCLEDGRFETAASYLMVMQSLESAQASRKQAMRLLNIALGHQKWVLIRDLVRFLQATHDVVDPKTGERQDITVALLRKHATHLLHSGRLRSLGFFSARLDYPLIDWLSATQLPSTVDLGESFAEMHRDFQWEPSDADDANASGRDSPPPTAQPLDVSSPISSQHASMLDTSDNVTLSTTSTTPANGTPRSPLPEEVLETMRQKREQLRFMLNVMFETKQYSWAVLLALMLQDAHGVQQIFEEVALDKQYTPGTLGLIKSVAPALASPIGTHYCPLMRAVPEHWETISHEVTKAGALDLERQLPEEQASQHANPDCVIC